MMSEQITDNCPGLSVKTDSYRFTIAWNPARGTYTAVAELYDKGEDTWGDRFEWGNISQEYPFLFPIPFLIRRYVDDPVCSSVLE